MSMKARAKQSSYHVQPKLQMNTIAIILIQEVFQSPSKIAHALWVQYPG